MELSWEIRNETMCLCSGFQPECEDNSMTKWHSSETVTGTTNWSATGEKEDHTTHPKWTKYKKTCMWMFWKMYSSLGEVIGANLHDLRLKWVQDVMLKA